MSYRNRGRKHVVQHGQQELLVVKLDALFNTFADVNIYKIAVMIVGEGFQMFVDNSLILDFIEFTKNMYLLPVKTLRGVRCRRPLM
jgi:hypothetical protein